METRIRTPKDVLLENWEKLNEVSREKVLAVVMGFALAEEKVRKEAVSSEDNA